MKVEIKNRWTARVIYTAEVPDDTPSGMAMRAALERAVSDRADLRGADLSDAVLRGADLSDAVLRDADLSDAVLRDADLSDADLSDAVLRGADLSDADLRGADLSDAVLRDADLRGADLSGADLSDAKRLRDATGNRREIKSLQIETYGITYTATHMQIGCQLHEIDRWWSFSDAQIEKMDSGALDWWRKWKPILRQIIATSPAVPGGEKPESE